MTKLPIGHPTPRYRRHRFPAEIIAPAVWLYYRFPLSLRDVEDPLAERGIDVSFQTVSEWVAKFGCKFAHQLRRRSRGNFADKWHLDEMVVSIKGEKYWLWRAVDANGYVLDALLQSRRNSKAALRLMRKLLRAQGITPRVSIARRTLTFLCDDEKSAGCGSNRRDNASVPSQPTVRIANLFHLHRKHLTATDHRQLRAHAITAWREIAMLIEA